MDSGLSAQLEGAVHDQGEARFRPVFRRISSTSPTRSYRRMRDEAPIYYDEEDDFYALTRHEDVAAAFKDFETFSSACGVDLHSIRSGLPSDAGAAEVDHLHGPARAPAHAQPAQQGVHAAGDPGAARQRHQQDRALPRQVDPDDFDVVQDFSGRSPSRSSPGMAGVPEDDAPAGPALDRRISLHREPGQIEMGEQALQANIESAMYLLRPGRRNGEPTRRTI